MKAISVTKFKNDRIMKSIRNKQNDSTIADQTDLGAKRTDGVVYLQHIFSLPKETKKFKSEFNAKTRKEQ